MSPRLTRRLQGLVLVFVLASFGAPLARLVAQPADPLAAGRRLFEAHCSFCHGPHGEGGRGPTLAQPTLPRASTDEALRRIIKSGLPGTEMPSSRLDPDQIIQLAAFVKSLGSRPVEAVPGDPARGARLYATKGACATCHSVQGHGGAIGPDLTEIGRKRSASHLLRSLVEPGAEVPLSYSAYRSDVSLPQNFLFVRVIARDGRTAAGVRVNEDTFSIQLRDLAGQVHSFFKSDLTELHKDWGVSPMPSYAAVFTPAELADVVAYLASLRNSPSPLDPEKTDRTNTILH